MDHTFHQHLNCVLIPTYEVSRAPKAARHAPTLLGEAQESGGEGFAEECGGNSGNLRAARGFVRIRDITAG